MNVPWPLRFLFSRALAAAAFWLVVTLGGCATVPANVPHQPSHCVLGSAHDAIGQRWTLECLNRE